MPATATATPLTLIAQIEAQQGALELTDHDLCVAVGFEREIVLTMIKAGSMKFPLTKIPALAKALALDPAELLKVALRETSPDLLQVIEETYNPLRLTSTEVNLIEHLRKLCGNTPASPLVFGGNGVSGAALSPRYIGMMGWASRFTRRRIQEQTAREKETELEIYRLDKRRCTSHLFLGAD